METSMDSRRWLVVGWDVVGAVGIAITLAGLQTRRNFVSSLVCLATLCHLSMHGRIRAPGYCPFITMI